MVGHGGGDGSPEEAWSPRGPPTPVGVASELGAGDPGPPTGREEGERIFPETQGPASQSTFKTALGLSFCGRWDWPLASGFVGLRALLWIQPHPARGVFPSARDQVGQKR